MVYSVYFSPTGTSRKNACAVGEVFSKDYKEIDVTVLSNKLELSAKRDDFVVFSFPVYGGRILGGALDGIANFKGDNTPCICLVTYGNRAYDFALCELCTFVKKLGFIPFSGGALIGQHTYGKIATGRPNADDLQETADFFAGLKDSVAKGEVKELENFTSFTSEDAGKGGRFYPLTSSDCVSCRLCEKMCPMGAISGVDFKVDNSKCIACFRCINICPKNAKNMDEASYQEFAKGFSERLSKRLENEYFA